MFEAFREMFKSSKEREKDQRNQRRRVSREIERRIGKLKETVQGYEKRVTQAQAAARDSLLAGDRVGAQRKLLSVRQSQIIVQNLESRVMVSETRLAQFEAAESGTEIASLLKSLSDTLNINPVDLEVTLGEIDDKLGETAEVDEVWEREATRDLERIGIKEVQGVPSIDEMMKDLERSAGVELSPDALKNPSPQATDARLERFRKLKEDAS